MPSVLSIAGLTKNYGSIRAVDALDLEVEQGSIFGILGPNGSGKTTTLGIVLEIIKPSAGRFEWTHNAVGNEARKKIGAFVETPNFYPYLSAMQNLKIAAAIKQVSNETILPAIQLTGLFSRRNSKFQTYSLGMKQRLAIASALLGEPDILVLDEPTNGLDPQGIAEIRNLIIDIGKKGKTIILASHLLDEVEKVCTHVAILKKGKLLVAGKVSDVLADEDQIEVAADDMNGLENTLKGFPKVKSLEKGNEKWLVKFSSKTGTEELNKFLIDKGIVLSHLKLRRKSLEKQYLEITENA